MKGKKITPQEFDAKLHREVAILVKAQRQKAGMRQQDLSDELGVSRAHVANIETGRYTMSLQTILDLATVFQCKPVELLPLDWQYAHEEAV